MQSLPSKPPPPNPMNQGWILGFIWWQLHQAENGIMWTRSTRGFAHANLTFRWIKVDRKEVRNEIFGVDSKALYGGRNPDAIWNLAAERECCTDKMKGSYGVKATITTE
ncbi:hypothetical protein C5167_036078 [Papaver somniferum]|nr:hypothetical protein C5167_036078 [Papaver somniferum]